MRWIRIAIALVLMALGVGLVLQYNFPEQTNKLTKSVESVKESILSLPRQADEDTTDAEQRPEPTAVPLGCPSDPQPLTNPVSMTLISQQLELPMISLGLDAEGAPAAPPGNEGYTVAWYNGGPLIGSDHGRAVLTSHTFHRGGALGNDLNNGLVKVGDLIKFTDAYGNTACYRYSGSLRILVADYDPESDVLYDFSGAPQLALVVCSDYTSSGEALGRVIHYADLVTESIAGTEALADQTAP